LILPAVSFLSSVDGEIGSKWSEERGKEEEESRVILPMKFSAFVEAFAGTVFRGVVDGGVASGAAETPDGKVIAVRAVAGNAGTTVQFVAPTLELLALVDDFFRKLK
jgi:hypothetical protein